MRIGEVQSPLVDWASCIYEENGEVFENAVFKLLDRPLDTGRLFYAKLRNAIPRNVNVEVYWNHFDAEVTGVVSGRDFEYGVSFIEPVMARVDKIVYIETIVEDMKEVASSQPSQSSDADQQDSSVLRP
ncbi:MAG: hypothetical protein WCD76_06560 [Pyrinomonadaceae bacterium]